MIDLIPQYEQSIAFLEQRIRELEAERSRMRPGANHDALTQRIIRLEIDVADMRYAISIMRQGSSHAETTAPIV